MVSTFVIVKVVVLNDQGDVLILKRGMTAPRRPGAWDLPGGFVEPGEDLAAAASREVKEEAGLDTTSYSLLHATSEYESNKGFAGSWLLFVTNTKQSDVTISWEHDEFKWVPKSALLEYVTEGKPASALAYVTKHGLLSAHHDIHPA